MLSAIPRIELKILNVKIFIGEGKIKNINLDGRADIFEHQDVKYFLEKRKGRIVNIYGTLRYKNHPFRYNIGYTIEEEMGRLYIEKMGEKTGELTLIDEIYHLLFELYSKYFIN